MERCENISIWRVLACTGVFLYHICYLVFDGNQGKVLSFGKYGVLFFFIITGFLAFSSEDIRENIWIYWKKRAIRILPMYLLIQLIWLLLFSISENSLLRGWKLLTTDFVGGTWTIWVTVVFYFIAPFLTKAVNSCLKAWIMFLLLCIPRYIFIMCRFDFLDRTWQYLCFCMQGVVIYYTLKEEKERLSLFLLAGIIILLQLSGSTDNYFFYSIVFMIMFISSKHVQINWKFVKRVVNIIDKYSYNIFLVHPVVFWFLSDCSIYVQILSGVLGTAVASYLSYQCVDLRLNRILRKAMN